MNLDTPSSSQPEQQVNIDSNSIPFTKIQIDMLQDFSRMIGLQVPYCKALEDTPSISLGVLEKAILIDVSNNKECIAYVTEQDTNNQLPSAQNVLTISRFVDSSKGVLEAPFPTALATVNLDKKIFEDGNYSGYFISVSPDGSKVALSFMKLDNKGNAEGIPNSRNANCLNYKVSSNENTNGNNHITLEKKQLKFQGRATFLDENNLALINEKVIKVYDINKGYKKNIGLI